MVEWKTLNKIVKSISIGLNPRQNFILNEEDATLYYVTVKEITTNKVVFSDSTDRITKKAKQIINNRSKLSEGDILFSGIGTIGKVAYVNIPTNNWDCSESVFLIKPNELEVKGKYLAYILSSEIAKNQYEKGAAGAIMKGVRKATLESLLIPIPSLSEQTRIVGILDTFTATIDNLKEQIAERRKQYEHYRDQLLDLEEERKLLIGDLFEFKNGLNKEKKYFGQGNPIVNYTDVYHNNKLTREVLKGKVTLDDNEIERFRVHRGDVFFTRTSETPEEIGYASVLLDEIDNCTFSGFLLRARPKTNMLLPRYCGYCFSSYKVRQDIIKLSTYTTRALTNGTSLSKISIPVPSLSEQSRIVSILDTFEASIQNLEAQLKEREKQYEYYRNKLLTFE